MAAPTNTDLVPAATQVAENLPAVAPTGAPMTYQAVSQMAQMVVQSKLFPQIQTPAQALTLMMLAQADGLHPIDAVRRYDIIQGRPAMKSQAMQAEFQKAGGKIEYHRSDDDACDATFTGPDGNSLRVCWDMKRAQAAGLTSKPGPWKQFPAAMLRARCVSEGVRAVLPGVCLGIYTPEEVEAFEPIPVQVREVAPERPQNVGRIPAPKRQEPENLAARPAPALPEETEQAIGEFGMCAEKAGLKVRKDGALAVSPKMLRELAFEIIGAEELADAAHPAWREPRPWEDAKAKLVDNLAAGWTVVDGKLMPPAPEISEEQRAKLRETLGVTDPDDFDDDDFEESFAPDAPAPKVGKGQGLL